MSASRTLQEVFHHHADRLAVADVEGIVADYAEDAVLITPSGVVRGPVALREAFRQLLADLPDAHWEIRTTISEGDVLLIEWGAESRTHRVVDGVDTFVIRDGSIRAQTARFTLSPVTAG